MKEYYNCIQCNAPYSKQFAVGDTLCPKCCDEELDKLGRGEDNYFTTGKLKEEQSK